MYRNRRYRVAGFCSILRPKIASRLRLWTPASCPLPVFLLGRCSRTSWSRLAISHGIFLALGRESCIKIVHSGFDRKVRRAVPQQGCEVTLIPRHPEHLKLKRNQARRACSFASTGDWASRGPIPFSVAPPERRDCSHEIFELSTQTRGWRRSQQYPSAGNWRPS